MNLHAAKIITPALGLTLAMVTMLLLGCGGDDKSDAGKDKKDGDKKEQTSAPVLPDGMLVTTAPGEPKSITALKADAKEGDEVIMQVTVGGRMKPIVENRAVVTVVDATLFNRCTTEGDHCETPWDYCCTIPEELQKNMATLQLVDDEGRPLAIDLTGSPIKPLATLVVKGKVGPRPEPNVLIVNASEIFVKK